MFTAITGVGLIVLLTLRFSSCQQERFYEGLAPRDQYCQEIPEHTACRFRQPNQLGKCGKVSARGLNRTDIDLILNSHNVFRSHVASGQQTGQPSAANMAKLTWDTEAASIAQLWVDQCVFSHDERRDTVWPGQATYNGQNLFASSNPNFSFRDPVDSWFKEVQNFNPSRVNSFQSDGQTGHYTQLVWAETTRVGCGYVKNGTWNIVACNYAPGGNILSTPVYLTGPPCSACPSALPSCDESYPGLCS